MDNKDDEKRRVMTPPAEWASGTIQKAPAAHESISTGVDAASGADELDELLGGNESDTDWLNDDFSDDLSTETALSPAPPLAEEEEAPGAIAPQDEEGAPSPHATQAQDTGDTAGDLDSGDQDDSWLDLDSTLSEAAELLAPSPEKENDWDNAAFLASNPEAKGRASDGTANNKAPSSLVRLEEDEPSNDVATPSPQAADAIRSQRDQADSDWIDANSAINKAPPEVNDTSSAKAPAAAEMLLTDHAAAPERKFPMWPAFLLIAALILLLVGGWGALSERSALKARIQTLEQANSRSKAAGDLDANAEQALTDDNQSLRLQLATMREQYAAMSSEISTLQEALVAQENNQAPMIEPAEAIVASNAPDTASAATEEELPEPVVANEAMALLSEPAAETATDAPVTPATSGLWFVNLGSYVDRDVAVEAIQQFAPMDKGLVIEAGDVKGRTYYRIRAINFATQGEAQAAAKQYENTFKMKPLWVGKSPAASVKSMDTTEAPEQPASQAKAKVALKTSAESGGWFIYIDTFARGKDADDRAQLINDAGFEAKVAVEFRQGELFYRVQVVGIESEAQGKEIIAKLKSLEDMPNLQLRRF